MRETHIRREKTFSAVQSPSPPTRIIFRNKRYHVTRSQSKLVRFSRIIILKRKLVNLEIFIDLKFLHKERGPLEVSLLEGEGEVSFWRQQQHSTQDSIEIKLGLRSKS
jgi:hypothetical protein